MRNALLPGLCLLALLVSAAPEIFPVFGTGGQDKAIQLTADKFDTDRKSGITTASGNARLRHGDNTLSADSMSINQQTGDVTAQGHVILKREGLGSWRGERIQYNPRTGKATVSAGVLRTTGDYSLGFEGLRREEDGTFVLSRAQATTCTNDWHFWHWSISADEVRLRENDCATLKGAVPWVLGIPVGYFPWWYRDLNAHYGFRANPVYRSKWGPALLNNYIWNIYRDRKQGNSLDANTHLDLYWKRGAGLGQDFNWDFGDWGTGSFHSYWIHDQDLSHHDRSDRNWESPVHRDRYILAAKHAVDLSPRDRVTAQGTYLSDTEFLNDFRQNDYRAQSQTINQINYEHREHAWLAGALVNGSLNDFFGGVSKLPEVYLDIAPYDLWQRFYYESSTRVGYYHRKPRVFEDADPIYKYAPGQWMDYDTVRVDTRHFLKRPISPVDGLTFTPRAGWRGTLYDDAEPAIGKDDANKSRNVLEFGLEGQARFSADYTTIRHTFKPYFDYTYVTDPIGMKDGSNYAFDRYDREYDWLDRFGEDGIYPNHEYHGLRFGVRNLFQQLKDRAAPPVVDLDLYGVYLFENGSDYSLFDGRATLADATLHRNARDTGFRVAGARLVWRPIEQVSLVGIGEYDPENGKLAYANAGLHVDLSPVAFGFGANSRNHEIYDYYWRDTLDDTVLYGYFTHQLTDLFSWNIYARGNTDSGDLEEIGGYLQYALDCVTFCLYGACLPSYTRIDGTDYDTDWRAGLTVWFNATPANPHEPWRRW